MITEPSFAEIQDARRQSAAKTIRQASTQELNALLAELFVDATHPWAVSFKRFVEDHRELSPYRGETSDGYGFVYYPDAGRGMWYLFREGLTGVGILGAANLKLLADLVEQMP
jgi:hypothetical protein